MSETGIGTRGVRWSIDGRHDSTLKREPDFPPYIEDVHDEHNGHGGHKTFVVSPPLTAAELNSRGQ